MNLPGLVRADSLAQQVYNVIRRGIRDGTIPLDQFFSETEFGTSMGVSRTPVREALLALFREGLVEIVPKRGFRLVRPGTDAIREVRLLRIALEQLVVDQLSRQTRPADIAALRGMLADQRRAKSSIFELDEAFHAEMARLAGLPETGRMLMSVRGKMYLIAGGTQLPELRTDEVLREHERIVDAIERGDPVFARGVMADHVGQSIDAFMSARSAAPVAREPSLA